MWWYISSLVNEWEWCIIPESDTGILGKKKIRVLLSGVEPIWYQRDVEHVKEQSAVGAKRSTRPQLSPVPRTFHAVYCHSSWIIYIIECNICKLQYIGKSETAFNLRLNNQRNHIKKGVSSCRLTEHFLHNTRSHDFDINVTITIIKQIKKDHLETDKKKEFLREREIFWQRTLNSIQPYGLNKRTG